MGGRGSSSGLTSQKNTIDIPTKFTKAELKKMSRTQLEKIATAIYAKRAMSSGLTHEEAVRRARALMDGNTTAQLQKYVNKYG